MKYRDLGDTGLKVSEIGFGGASISGEGKGYGFGAITENDAISLLREAVDLGINLIDTAPIYGFSLSEKRIGLAFSKDEREKLTIISKSGVSWHDNGRVNMSNDLETTEKMLHTSLKDLQTEYIDLYMVHWPDAKVDIRKVMEFYMRAKEQGKIRHIGLCNTTLEDLEKAEEITKIDVLQSELNYFNTQVTKDLFSKISKQNMGFMSWGTLDKGILTGRLTKDHMYNDDDDCRKSAPWWNKEEVLSKIEVVDKFKHLVADADHSLLEFALGHNLRFSEVSQVLCGARNTDQLNSLVKAIDHLPGEELYQEIEQLLNE